MQLLWFQVNKTSSGSLKVLKTYVCKHFLEAKVVILDYNRQDLHRRDIRSDEKQEKQSTNGMILAFHKKVFTMIFFATKEQQRIFMREKLFPVEVTY